MAARIHQVALHVVDRDRVAVAVVIQAFAGIGRSAYEIERAIARAEQIRGAIAGAVAFVGQRAAGAHTDVMETFAIFARRTLGDDVDDATGSTQALERIGAVDYFDTLDHGRVDGVTIAAAFAQR